MKRPNPAVWAISALLLAGCGGSKKIAATVNGETISEEEYQTRLVNTSGFEMAAALQAGGSARAGEFALKQLVYEKLLFQLAKQKGVAPTEAEVTSYVAFAKKYPNWQVTFVTVNPSRTEEEWRRDSRSALCIKKMAMAPFKLTDKEIADEYAILKDKQLTPPDQYHLRVIDAKTPEKVAAILQMLNKGMRFETVALLHSEDEETKKRSGDAGFIQQPALPVPVLMAVKDLKPNEYTKTAVTLTPADVTNTAMQGMQGTHHAILQLVEKKVGQAPTLEEAKPLVERLILNQRDPNAMQRVREEIMKFQDTSKLEVKLPGMEKLLDKPAKTAAQPGGQPLNSPGQPQGAAPTAPK